MLKEGQRLKHDDVVFISTDLVLAIEILPSDVIVLSPQTLPEMARCYYEIGNKHSPLFLDGDELLLPYDNQCLSGCVLPGLRQNRRSVV